MKSVGIVFGLLLLLCALAWAHRAPTDSNGCHVDRRGYYHCHP